MVAERYSLSEEEVAQCVDTINADLRDLEYDMRSTGGAAGALVGQIMDYPLKGSQGALGARTQRFEKIFASPRLPMVLQDFLPRWEDIQERWWDIARAYKPLAMSYVRQRFGGAQSHFYSHYDELRSEANLGLYEAAQRFDTERGKRFSLYCLSWVKQKCIRYVESVEKHPDNPYDRAHDVNDDDEHGKAGFVDDTLAATDPESDPEYNILNREDTEHRDIRWDIISEVLYTLSQRKKYICTLILDGTSQADVAQELEISKTNVATTWRTFRQLCRDRLSKRALVVA